MTRGELRNLRPRQVVQLGSGPVMITGQPNAMTAIVVRPSGGPPLFGGSGEAGRSFRCCLHWIAAAAGIEFTSPIRCERCGQTAEARLVYGLAPDDPGEEYHVDCPICGHQELWQNDERGVPVAVEPMVDLDLFLEHQDRLDRGGRDTDAPAW